MTFNPIEVYVETGQKRAFAVALDWPGWARSGRDDASALQALLDYGSRYARVLASTGLDFQPPATLDDLRVLEQVPGTATTDFGALDITLARDAAPVDPAELERWHIILQACWRAFDSAVNAAAGKSLARGPRGGGRDLSKIVAHLYESHVGYLNSLGGRLTTPTPDDPAHALGHVREAILTTLTAAVNGDIPARGPRGGLRWTPRYFVRRLAWHELDHAWEIEDRAL